ncbi:MAG: hypothetical protein ACLRMJ_05800 [Alistipes finegoldii]
MRDMHRWGGRGLVRRQLLGERKSFSKSPMARHVGNQNKSGASPQEPWL